MSFLRLLRWEMFKLIRRRASYVGFVLCLIFCGAVLVGFAWSEWKGMRRNSGGLIDPTKFINGWFFAYFATSISFITLLPLLAAVVPGSQIAGEAKEGTLRALLVRPPSRPLVFGAKALVSFAWMLLLVFGLMAMAAILGRLLLGGGNPMIFEWEFNRAGPWFPDRGDAVWIFMVMGLGMALSLYMIAAFALMLSATTDNPVVAIVGTLGAFFTSSVIHTFPDQVMSPDFKALMPTRHMAFWRELPHLFHPEPERFDAARVWSDLAWVGGYTALFLVIGLVVFSRRDVTS